MPVNYRTQQVGVAKIFYREAGAKNAPVLLLLHGFPHRATCFASLFRCSPIVIA